MAIADDNHGMGQVSAAIGRVNYAFIVVEKRESGFGIDTDCYRLLSHCLEQSLRVLFGKYHVTG